MTGDSLRSLVIASDYRVPDPTRVWPLLERRKEALADIGAHHVLVYTSTHDYGRVLVLIGVHSREPIVELIRSRVFFDWFDAAGVEDIPAVFAGEIVDRFIAVPPAAPSAPGVVVAAFASVDDVATLNAEVGFALDRFTAAGIRKTYQGTRVSALLFGSLRRMADRFDRLTCTWMHPGNVLSLSAAARAGLQAHKHFQIYRKRLINGEGGLP